LAGQYPGTATHHRKGGYLCESNV
jgi:PEP_resp_reg: putative PEP-CTERM system response regulator